MKRNNAVKKLKNSQINANGNVDYDDFPEVVPFLEAVSNHNLGIYKAPKKRYRKSIFRVTNSTKFFLNFNISKVIFLYFHINYISVGIDIPDYISSGGNPEAIKNMSSKLKALGKRRRR